MINRVMIYISMNTKSIYMKKHVSRVLGEACNHSLLLSNSGKIGPLYFCFYMLKIIEFTALLGFLYCCEKTLLLL